MLVAHQLSRALEQRVDKHPQLYDLRSGRLEEDIDVVLLLCRESYYEEGTDDITEVLLAEVIQGEGGKRVCLLFDRQVQCYRNLGE